MGKNIEFGVGWSWVQISPLSHINCASLSKVLHLSKSSKRGLFYLLLRAQLKLSINSPRWGQEAPRWEGSGAGSQELCLAGFLYQPCPCVASLMFARLSSASTNWWQHASFFRHQQRRSGFSSEFLSNFPVQGHHRKLTEVLVS